MLATETLAVPRLSHGLTEIFCVVSGADRVLNFKVDFRTSSTSARPAIGVFSHRFGNSTEGLNQCGGGPEPMVRLGGVKVRKEKPTADVVNLYF